jgi:N6-L-threonylcarbamoyladenine synthase
VQSVIEVLGHKAIKALEELNCRDLVVAGGVGANIQLRERLTQMARDRGCIVHYPPMDLCTDNGVMIAFAGALRLLHINLVTKNLGAFDIQPRWDLSSLNVN